MPVHDVAYRLRRILAAITISALLILLGCAPGPALRPATDAAGDTQSPTAEAASVVVTAQPGEWEGTPDQIDGYTPVRVRFENNGDRPVRIRYTDFQLTAGDSTITPVDPRAVEGTAYASIHDHGYGAGSGYSHRGFHVASHHLGLARAGHSPHSFGYGGGHGFGYGFSPYGFGYGFSPYGFGYGGLGFSRFGYGGYGYGSPSRAVKLPTRDMLVAALPEGFLEPGGHVEGFVYFPTEKIPRSADGERPVSAPLTVTIVDAETSTTLGDLSIPFVYRS